MPAEHIPRRFPVCTCRLPALDHRPSHNPKAWPICPCGAYARNHRVKHNYVGDEALCLKCHLPAKQHVCRGPSHNIPYRIPYVGLDGEGIGRRPHRYVLLCAAAIDGRRWTLEDTNGLTSLRMLNWILDTLDGCRVFSYGFGYDITHLVKDLPDKAIYNLLRPNRRYDKGKLRPVRWQGFKLDWLQGKFTIAKGERRVVVWDLLKFFQQSFVGTLKEWLDDSERSELGLADIEEMKAKRNKFTLRDMPAIRDYCVRECRALAVVAEKLLVAHKAAGLTLKTYYGPGSAASVMLSQMKVKTFTKDPPDAMREAIAKAFFGGRFEHSTMGIVKPVYAYDISSAYPYHAYNLPCLKHGKWEWVTSGINKALRHCTTALVRYTYRGSPNDVWAPFPHRSAKGNICYPYTNQGWAWLPEYLGAIGWGNLTALGAWVYRTDCDCRPFGRLSDYYRRRVELGKDARGRVIKLAVNSGSYGKLAQSKGHNPPYQNWVWAGLVTAGTRAQVLQAIQAVSSKPARETNIIAVATDGIFSRIPLRLRTPHDTGTSDLPKPLGGWEEKVYPEGILFLKPGIYLALSGEGTVKARGVGRSALLKQRRQIAAAYSRGARSWTVHVDRFHGAKSSITPKRRTERFGQWSRMPINIAFECPNRRSDDMGLLARDTESAPYDPSLVTAETLQARLHQDISYEQP